MKLILCLLYIYIPALKACQTAASKSPTASLSAQAMSLSSSAVRSPHSMAM